MTTTKRIVKNPAKAGTLSKKVIQDAVNTVAEKATNVANKATPKKPTIKSLQQEVVSKDVSISALLATVERLEEYVKAYSDAYIRESNKPIWTIIKERFVGFIYRMSWKFR